MNSETVARWDAFLAKIRERAEETLQQGEEGCAMLLDVNALDPQPMTIAWMAIENQLRELAEKIDQTWDAKVGPALGDAADGQHGKGEALKRQLERKKDEAELRLFAGAARKIYEQARVELSKDRKCAQCGAALKLEQAFFRSTHLPCPFCQSVNTFVPGSTIAAVEYFCAHHLARAQSAPQYAVWLEKNDEASLRAYTVAYLNARIAIVPEYAKDFDKDLKGKMAFFYEHPQ